MKKLLPLALGILTFGSSMAQTADSVSMGASYASNVYYSFENGEVHSSDATAWELAFGTTGTFDVNIRINGGHGVELYLYPNGDTADWNNIDTTGLGSWSQKYNSDTAWDVTAFTPPGLSHPDYGWGIYNQVSHNVIGDSIYIMKTTDGTFKKFKMNAMTTSQLFTFTYADIDGQNEVIDTVDRNMYITKQFAYYDMNNAEVLDLDPAHADWDIKFTKYMQLQPQGVFYPVTGVLANTERLTARVAGVAVEDAEWFGQDYHSNIGLIGSDWKYFDMGSFSWMLQDSLSYFFVDSAEQVWHLAFTGFEGSSTGNINFVKNKVGALSVENITALNNDVNIYPNPVSNNFSVEVDINNNATDVRLEVYNLTGAVIYQSNVIAGMQTLQLDASNWQNGVYLVRVGNQSNALVKKLIKQ